MIGVFVAFVVLGAWLFATQVEINRLGSRISSLESERWREQKRVDELAETVDDLEVWADVDRRLSTTRYHRLRKRIQAIEKESAEAEAAVKEFLGDGQ